MPLAVRATYIPECPSIHRLCHARCFEGMRDAKVHHVDAILRVQHDVLRFQIAMNHAGSVGRFQCAANLRDDPYRLVRRKFSSFTEHGAKIAASTNSMVMNLNPWPVQIENTNDIAVGNFASQDQFLFEAEEDFRIAARSARISLRATRRPSSVSRAL